jgi:hypothetical protein
MAKRSRIRKTAEQQAAEALVKRGLDLEAVNLPKEGSALGTQDNIEVTRKGEKREGRAVEENSARRLDAFEALKAGMVAGAYDAARRLETDILIRRGENDKGRATGRVDRTAGLTTDAMIQAAQRIEQIIDRIPPRDWWLLNELIAPAVERKPWREAVQYITGERHTEGQASAVRAACVNLRDAYAMLDRKAAA